MLGTLEGGRGRSRCLGLCEKIEISDALLMERSRALEHAQYITYENSQARRLPADGSKPKDWSSNPYKQCRATADRL